VIRLSERFKQILQQRIMGRSETEDPNDLSTTVLAITETLDEFQTEVAAMLSAIKPAPVALKGAWWERTGAQRRK